MSEIKVNKISPRTACGTTTLGDSGDTFTIPAGVSITNSGTASGFGATGAVSWNTTVKTSGFTATAGEGYFVNTTGGAVTVNLPAGTAGAVVGFKDYAGTFDSNALTLNLNGSDKIGGETSNPIIGTEGIAITLVFIDSTQGWLVTDSGLQSEAPGPKFVTATGGTVTTSGDFKIHTFTGPGTFQVTCGGNAAGTSSVDYMVVAGGGGGKGNAGNSDGQAGGGAGGYRESSGAASGCYSRSPLGACVSALPVIAQDYPITVGAGGSGGPAGNNNGSKGASSSFSTITSAGGGHNGPSGSADASGGSGGGGSGGGGASCVGAGNTPPVSPPQGNPGGNGANTGPSAAGGGGGATAVGGNGSAPSGGAGDGGAGATSSINGTPTARAGGGGGTAYSQGTCKEGAGGLGGGGKGGCAKGVPGTAGTTNTGGGGGAGATDTGGQPTVATTGGAGGSGIVIIRYKFQ